MRVKICRIGKVSGLRKHFGQPFFIPMDNEDEFENRVALRGIVPINDEHVPYPAESLADGKIAGPIPTASVRWG